MNAPAAASAPARTRVVHVTTVHPRDDIRIFRKQCLSLAAAGYEVVQVVGDGQGDALVDGVRIVDIGARPAGRLARMRRQPRAALAAVRRLEPALVHLHDPELLPLGVALARDGVPVVYDAHEDLPRQILTKQWIPAPLRRPLAALVEAFENRQVRRLAAVSAATPHIARRFASVAPKSVVVANYPDLAELAPPAEARPRERALCYVGGITRTRGALQMLRAVALLPGTRLVLAGDIEDEALRAAMQAEPGWAQTEYLGRIGREQVRELLARCSVGLVTLLPMPSYRDALPIKLFEYMAAELPVLASDFALWREIVDAAGCGLCVAPEDPAAIAAAAAALLDDPARAAAMGRAGRAAATTRYHWALARAELLALYRALLGPSAVPAEPAGPGEVA